MKKSKYIPVVMAVVFFIIILPLTGYASNNQGFEVSKKIKLGVSIATMREDVYHLMKEAMFDNQERDNVEVIWKDAGNNEIKQADDVESLLKEDVDVIIFHPVNGNTEGQLIKKIQQAGLPVVGIDRLVNNVNMDCYVSANNFKAGMEQAEYLADQLDHEGKIIILKGDKNHNVTHEITMGNKEVLKKEPKVEIIGEEYHHHWSAKAAEETTREILMNYPDIKGILANNSSMAMAAVKVLKEMNLIEKVVTVGADASKEACLAIARGEHDADIDKMPYLVGLIAYKIAIHIVREKPFLYDLRINNGNYKIPLSLVPIMLIDKYNLINMERRWGPLPGK